MPSKLVIGEHCTGPRTLISWAREGGGLQLEETVLEKVGKTRETLEEEAKHRKVYGYHTRLGRLYDAEANWTPETELVVLKEHAMGTWEPHGPVTGRLFTVTWLLQMTRGGSPVQPSTLQHIVDTINCGYSPAIPAYGSVGASGDLAPASHVALALLYGEGRLWSPKGELVPAGEALAECGLGAHRLARGEALQLINTTAYSTTLLLLAANALEAMNEYALENTRLIYRAAKGNCEHIDEALSKLKRHPGLRRVLEEIQCACTWKPNRLQDPYSIRCSPILLGAVYDQLEKAYDTAQREYCSTSTNPAVADGRVVHACMFHAIYPALAMDSLAPAIALLANLAERRISQIMDSKITGLPPFLAKPESSVGLMITHYTAAALASEVRSDSMPRSVNSIPTSLLQEDIVSMAPNSGIRLARQLWILSEILAVERTVSLAALEGTDVGDARSRWSLESENLRNKALLGRHPGLYA